MNHFKKSNNKLEKLRGIFFQIGLIIAGGLTLLAFEWMTPIYSYDLPTPDETYEVPWEIPPIIPEKEVEKPKVKIKPVLPNPETFKIVKTLIEPVLKPSPEPEPVFDPSKYSNPDPEPSPEPEEFRIVEKMPAFIGGDKARTKFLRDNLKYPEMDRATGTVGTVYLQFLVNKKGEIKEVEVLRGVNKRLDKEAVRVVKAMPNWSPGKQRGKAVNVRFSFRVTFALK